MDIFQTIAERRIQEAIESGEFDNLPNRGKPLKMDEDFFIPQDLRMAYRVLKNAGCLPPELELRNEIISLRMMIDSLDDDRERTKKIRELNFKILKLNELRKRPFNLEDFPEYERKIVDKFIP
ncbi:MAG: DnaJ family domain-containing protein [Thermodesulfovibrionales bacterium]